MKKVVFLCGFTAWFFNVLGQSNPETQQLLAKQDKHYFIENKGQWHSDVLYLARMGGLDAWITKYGVNYTFYKLEEVASPNKKEEDLHMPEKFKHKDYNVIGHRVLMQLENHNPNPAREGLHQQSGYYNYFIGNDDSKHATNVGLYKEAIVKNVYQGIDLRYYFDKGALRYDYVVHAGADPSQISFKLAGANKTYLNDKGQLVFETRFGEVAMADLEVYQGVDKKRVQAQFTCMAGERWGFSLGEYDKTQDLVIDPLIYSTFLGGGEEDIAYDIALDDSGNVFIAGETSSTDYDITTGSFQTIMLSGYDAFVTKLSLTSLSLVYSTYIGGNDNDAAYAIDVDGVGNAYITGYTWSSNYDVTNGVIQPSNDGRIDIIITKLNSTGTSLLYSTYLGGMYDDEGYDIAVDSSGNAYITGMTRSTDFDITPSAYQTTLQGSFWNTFPPKEAFVAKINSTGTVLMYSTYLGGNSDDQGNGIAVNDSGNAFITGFTYSSNFDATPGAFQTNGPINNNDVFVTKLNSTGSALIYSTLIGGKSSDKGYAIEVDRDGNAYITGSTGGEYKVTTDSYKPFYQGKGDVFVTKLNPSGSALVYSTYLGGNQQDVGIDIDLDGKRNVYITGVTSSLNFDYTPNAFQTTFGGNGCNYPPCTDVFVSKLDSTGSILIYSTYLGGSDNDNGLAIAVDDSNHAYVTGKTMSADFDVSPWAYQNTFANGVSDIFFTKLKAYTQIKGSIFLDVTPNCIQDTLETRLQAPLVVTIQPGNYTTQVYSNGFWYISDTLPAGTYTAMVDTSGSWKASCSPSVSFTVVHPDSSVIAPPIGMYNANPCSDPQISIFMPFMRPCFSNQWIKVESCNTAMGTDILHNAYADVELDSLVQVDSASLAYTYQGNGVYRFLLDSLYPGQCKAWYIYTTLSCSAVLGQTLCMEAELYPVPACAIDTTPNPVSGVSPCTLPWDKSSLSVDGACVNDSVRFVIYNTGDPGDGDMQCFMPIRLYADGQLVRLDSLKINGGDSLVIQFAGDGRTWRIEVDQHPLHPGNSHPNATVQACGNGGFNSPNWTPGLVNVLPPDDAEPWKDIYCGEVRLAYDPNDKTGYPLGVGEDHHIAPNQPIEYVIRFQNTGTDTAFKVVIRDTLSTNLDIYSVRLGVASHAYTFRMYGQRVLEWTFENILLPDSFTNEPASHGFVTFSVNQVRDLPDNTIIANSAAIYFDFNAPVITNTYEHTVMRSVVTSRDASVEHSGGMRVYPNPSSGLLQVEWGGGSCVVELLNVQGQVLDRYELRGGKGVVDISGYPAALYLLKGTHGGGVGVVKVVKE